MDKTLLKNFAIYSRNKLIKEVQSKANLIGISKEGITKPLNESTETMLIFNTIGENKYKIYDNDVVKYAKLIKEIKTRVKENDYKYVYNLLVEEIAYMWFYRLLAIRFMEVNNYLTNNVRVLSTNRKDCNKPDIIENYKQVDLDLSKNDLNKIETLQRKNTDNASNKILKLLVIKVCHNLSDNFSDLFKNNEDYMELFLELDYLDQDSVLYKLVNEIPERYFDIKKDGQVEIIGWLHQYYNVERKNEVINVFKKHIIKKEDIPAATQFFTTEWVVKYMVDNSLGKYWLERNPNSSLKQSLKYLVDQDIDYVEEDLSVVDIRFLDNAMGSGHILLYAFDVFLKIYLEQGYAAQDAVILILNHNLYGLDIDDRAFMLAHFALLMKAREHNPKILSSNIKHNLISFTDSTNIDCTPLDNFGRSMFRIARDKAIVQMSNLIETFKNATEIGSILIVDDFDKKLLLEFINDNNCDKETQDKLLDILKMAMLLDKKYDIVVTNPPYLNKFSPKLKAYIDDNYKDYNKDLFSVFIYKNIEMCKENGYAAYMTPFVWMFIKTYTKLRKFILDNKHISSLIQLEYSAFSEASVPICTFVLQNKLTNNTGKYIKLSNFVGDMNVQKEKTLYAINNQDCDYIYENIDASFKKIPGMPIAYWASDNIIKVFDEGLPMGTLLEVRQGMATGNNNKYLRLWWEVDINDIAFDTLSLADYHSRFNKKYVPYNKGGKKRQWYGNYDYVIKFDENNYNQLLKSGNHLPSRSFYFQKAITWGLITSGGFSIRYRESGSVHDVAGMSAFCDDTKLLNYIFGLMSTPIANYIFKILNPTINLQAGDFKNFPVIIEDNQSEVIKLVKENVRLSKDDWNSFETAWDFKHHGLINKNNDFNLIKDAYTNYKVKVNKRFNKIKLNQEKLNEFFIDMYNLNDEIEVKVRDKDITTTKILDYKVDIDEDIKGNRSVLLKKDVIKSFVSYAVGYMFGRYYLDIAGLNINNSANIIVLSNEDILKRFICFTETVYGKDNLEKNLTFIADALGSGENSREVIRNYFINDYYIDHVKNYQKRPIYLMYDSGGSNPFRALVYIHNYNKVDINKELITKINKLDSTNTEIKQLRNKLEKLSMSNKKINLDDGFKYNYNKVQTDLKGENLEVLIKV